MQILKRLFRFSLLSLLGLVVFIVGVVGVAWFFPHLWINEKTVRFASHFTPEIGVPIYFNGPLEVQVQTTSIFGKRLVLKAQKVCVAVPDSGLDMCADLLDLDAKVLLRFGFSIQSIERLVVEGARVAIRSSGKKAPEKNSEEESLDWDLPLGLKSAKLGKIVLGLRSLRLEDKEQITQVQGDVTVNEAGEGLVLDIHSKTTLIPVHVGGVRPPVREQIQANLKVSLASRDLLSLRTADLNAFYKGSFLFPVYLKANLDRERVWLGVSRNAKEAPVIQGDIQYKMKAATLTLQEAKGKITVDKFESLVALLRPTPYAVPTPASALTGPLILDVGYEATKEAAVLPLHLVTHLSSVNQRFELLAEAKLKLASAEGMHLQADIALNEVQLALPPLNIEKIPPIFPDSRIQPEDRQRLPTGEEDSFHYNIRIHTTSNRALLLSTNLAKEQVPVEIDLTLQSYRPMSGQIRLGSARLDVFRRNAALQDAELRFSGTDLPPTLKADLKVKYAEYTVFVHFFGTTERPDFFLTSEPPLSEQDALSVLLFGRTASEIDSSDAESLAGTRAAIANRALGLASMYLLATTPIESVGYDPVANTVSTRVRLRDGTTLQVKSSTRGVAGLGIRQKLGGPWSIRTEIENLEQQQAERSASAVLEWSRRY